MLMDCRLVSRLLTLVTLLKSKKRVNKRNVISNMQLDLRWLQFAFFKHSVTIFMCNQHKNNQVHK